MFRRRHMHSSECCHYVPKTKTCFFMNCKLHRFTTCLAKLHAYSRNQRNLEQLAIAWYLITESLIILTRIQTIPKQQMRSMNKNRFSSLRFSLSRSAQILQIKTWINHINFVFSVQTVHTAVMKVQGNTLGGLENGEPRSLSPKHSPYSSTVSSLYRSTICFLMLMTLLPESMSNSCCKDTVMCHKSPAKIQYGGSSIIDLKINWFTWHNRALYSGLYLDHGIPLLSILIYSGS